MLYRVLHTRPGSTFCILGRYRQANLDGSIRLSELQANDLREQGYSLEPLGESSAAGVKANAIDADAAQRIADNRAAADEASAAAQRIDADRAKDLNAPRRRGRPPKARQ